MIFKVVCFTKLFFICLPANFICEKYFNGVFDSNEENDDADRFYVIFNHWFDLQKHENATETDQICVRNCKYRYGRSFRQLYFESGFQVTVEVSGSYIF